MSNLYKVVQFSPLKGFWSRLDSQMIAREGLGVCEFSSITKLFSKHKVVSAQLSYHKVLL